MSERPEDGEPKRRKPPVGAGMAIGVAIGVALGAAFDNVVMGLVVGGVFDWQNRQQSERCASASAFVC